MFQVLPLNGFDQVSQKIKNKKKHWSGQPQLQNTTHYPATGLNLCRRVALNASETIYGLISTLFVFLLKRTTHKNPNPRPHSPEIQRIHFQLGLLGGKEGDTLHSKLRG